MIAVPDLTDVLVLSALWGAFWTVIWIRVRDRIR